EASDVHIEPQRKKLRIRFRVDGELREVASLPAEVAHPLISRVKVMAQLRLDEERVPQGGRFRSTVFGRNIDFRVSTFPTPAGEKVVIRVLDPTIGMKSLEELGLNSYHKKPFIEAIESPHGMTLMTGPTSSGKTTTLYAVINRLNKESVNIVSLEDPVEYFIEGVNQSQVMPDIGYDFASGLRRILRQDPDIIMVGEIRDGETASLAVNAALTGHLMLSTLHTNSSIGVIPRLIDLGVPPFLLSSSLNMMAAQRLVLKLCPNCKFKKEAPEKVAEVMEREFEQLSQNIKDQLDVDFERPYEVYDTSPDENCEICNGQGNSGRTALFEMFQMTKRLGGIITDEFDENDLLDEA
ncbi:MAG: GspE/PulE family protein, partial [Candidatus Magasanikbacteria bacterium]